MKRTKVSTLSDVIESIFVPVNYAPELSEPEAILENAYNNILMLQVEVYKLADKGILSQNCVIQVENLALEISSKVDAHRP